MLTNDIYYIDGFQVDPTDNLTLGITFKPDDKLKLVKKKLTGKITLVNECCEASGQNYYEIIQQQQKINVCKRYEFELTEYTDDGYKTAFKGYFRVYNCFFNPEDGTVDITITADDAFDCLEKNWEDKHNVLEDGMDQIDLLVGTDPITFDILIVTDNFNTPEPDFDIVDGYGYIGTINDIYCENQYDEFIAFTVTSAYARLKSLTQIGPSWYNIGDYWYLPYDSATSPRILQVNMSQPIGGIYEGYDYSLSNACDEISGSTIINSGGTVNNLNTTIQGWVSLGDVIDFLVQKLNCDAITGYHSELLNADANYVTLEPDNPLKRIYLTDSSNLVNAGGSPATLFELSMKLVLDILHQLLQAKIDLKNQKLHIEHDAKIEGYDEYDLMQESEFENQYGFDLKKLSAKEIWEVADQLVEMHYGNDCGTNKPISHIDKGIYTNIAIMVNNDEYPLDGIVVAIDDGTGVAQPTELSLENLVIKYWSHNRPFGTFKIGENEYNSKTVIPIVEQNEFQYHLACINNFKPKNFFLTHLGKGTLKSATWLIASKQMKIKLNQNA